MADRAQQIAPLGWAGIAAAAAVPLLILTTALAVVASADSYRGITPADWAAIRFTVWQAFLSALISTALAIPVARALARRNFPGRNALITLLGAPFLLPVIVAIFGLLAIFGRNGWLNVAITSLGFEPLSIYGLHGVVLAHVFFNLPLATRLILQGWQSIPSERFRLAASLDLSAQAQFRHLELPMLKRALPPAFLVIFVICTTSFAVALTLGGGPRATTVELAIYQAIRFEFDLARAAYLAVIQLGITALATFAALKWLYVPDYGAWQDRDVQMWQRKSVARASIDAVALTTAALILVLPLVSVVLAGAGTILTLPSVVMAATLRSVGIALASTALVTIASLAIAIAASRLGQKGRWIEIAGLTAIAASPLVVGTGLFILVFPIADPTALAVPVTILVNAIATLPFALRALIPAVADAEQQFGRLADSLPLTGWARVRLLILPRVRRPLGFAAGLAAALSMGDLGVIALFAGQENATLPLEIYRLMGAYRMEDAAGASLLLLLTSFALFALFDWGGRGNASG